MYISITAAVLLVPALFGAGLVVGGLAMFWHLRYEAADLKAQRTEIDRWERGTTTGLMDRLTAMDSEPEPDPPAEVFVPTAADISIVDHRPWALDRVLAAAVLMGALMERGQRGPARYGRHSGEHNAAGHELLVALLTKTQQMRTIGSEVA